MNMYMNICEYTVPNPQSAPCSAWVFRVATGTLFVPVAQRRAVFRCYVPVHVHKNL